MSVFKRTVLDPLQNGEMHGDTPGQNQLDASKLADDDVQAYIVRPERTCHRRPTSDGYDNRYNKLRSEVNKIIPKLGEEDGQGNLVRWREVIYNRLDRDDPRLFTTARGRVLFKFDPKHHGKKKAALWLEDQRQPIHNDEW